MLNPSPARGGASGQRVLGLEMEFRSLSNTRPLRQGARLTVREPLECRVGGMRATAPSFLLLDSGPRSGRRAGTSRMAECRWFGGRPAGMRADCRLPGYAGMAKCRPGTPPGGQAACQSPVRGRGVRPDRACAGQSGTRAGVRSAANHAAMGWIAGTSDMEWGLLASGAGARMRRSNEWSRGRRHPFFERDAPSDGPPPPKRRITRPLPPRPAGFRAGALSGWIPRDPASDACCCLCPL